MYLSATAHRASVQAIKIGSIPNRGDPDWNRRREAAPVRYQAAAAFCSEAEDAVSDGVQVRPQNALLQTVRKHPHLDSCQL